ncbi:MAG: PQQ-binding-like beta-propeller repeat protein [Bacteroidales bacterium]|nr:PQQ-binding-like beta-propeller repeat protein [Bacteroidales bacterium]MCF8456129.1 PQQ-binding-like beta-propeller repeat protein [Bacteroidales bacterium]
MKISTLFLSVFFLLSISLSAQVPQIKWWYDVHDSSFGNSAMADIDFDGKLEIVFSCYRSDSTIYAINAEDGSLLWKYNTGGCNDVAPIIYDVDMDDTLEVILPSSCVPKTFCFDGPTGQVEWVTTLHGSDSPPSIADIDFDGKPEILHGNFSGWVTCLNGEDGSIAWDIQVDQNCWIQTAPAILDIDNDNQLEFIVANWSFGTNHKIFCYHAHNHALMWTSDLPDDVMYHGAAFADIDGDGFMELAIGTYDGTLLVLNAEDGSLKWDYAVSNPLYAGGAVSIADLNNDQHYEIVYFDYYHLEVLDSQGSLFWEYTIPSYGQSFRGAAISDVNNDDTLDVVFGTSKGDVIALSGSSGDELWLIDLAAHHDSAEFDIDHAPLIGDFDQDGYMDVFIVGGRTIYPDTLETNYGRAYAISTESPGGPNWPMFRHDIRRSGTVPIVDTSTISISSQKAQDYFLEVYPNPASHWFNIEFKLKKNTYIKIQLSDVSGKIIQILSEGVELAGSHYQKINFGIDKELNFPPGIYFLTFLTDRESISKKIIVLE